MNAVEPQILDTVQERFHAKEADVGCDVARGTGPAGRPQANVQQRRPFDRSWPLEEREERRGSVDRSTIGMRRLSSPCIVATQFGSAVGANLAQTGEAATSPGGSAPPHPPAAPASWPNR